MTELVKHDERLLEMEVEGRKLYQTNQHYRNIVTVMEHPEFRKFYDLYMNDHLSMRTIIMFLKLYDAIEKKGKKHLTPYQKLTVLDQIMSNGKMRQSAVRCILDWYATDSLSNDTIGKCIETSTGSKC